MKRKSIVSVFLTLTALSASLMATPVFSAEPEHITFALDWTPNTNHTGVYVAKALGYFEENGLDVDIVQPPEYSTETLVASGQAQFGVSFQDYLAPALSGDDILPITAVAALVQHNTSGIVSLKENGIDSPKKMSGHSYATWELPVELATIKTVVEKDGGDFDQIQMIPNTVTDEVSALLSKSVDAIWIFYGWAGVKMELENLDVNYFAFADIDPVFDYYTPVLIAQDDYLKNNPDSAKRFLKAVRDGYEYAIENPEEAAKLLCEAAPELDPELVLASQNYMTDQYKAEVDQWGYIDSERWNAFFSWLNENGLVENELPMDTGFTNDFLPDKE